MAAISKYQAAYIQPIIEAEIERTREFLGEVDQKGLDPKVFHNHIAFLEEVVEVIKEMKKS